MTLNAFFRLCWLIFMVAGLFCRSAFALTKSWDGGAGTANWADAANWSPDGAPTSSDAVMLDNSIVNPLPQVNAQSGANAARFVLDGTVSNATFLNYGGATPLPLNLFGASVNAANTGPMVQITANAPQSVAVNKVEFRLRTSGTFDIASGRQLTLYNCYLTESGGSFSLTKSGAGTLTFNGSGPKVTFTGGLNMAEGFLVATTTNSLPVSGAVQFTNPLGTVAVIQSENSHSIAALAGGNSDSLIAITGTAGLTVTGSTNTTFSGIIDDNGSSLTKFVYAGSGTMTLNGANTYTGATTVSSGRLAMGADGTILSPSIALGAGATLDITANPDFSQADSFALSGSGTVVGAFAAGDDFTVAPGTTAGAVGTLTFSNGFTLGSGAHFACNVTGSTASQIIVSSGTVILAGDLAGSQTSGTVPIGTIFYLIRHDGSGPTIGTLAGVGDGGKVTIGSQSYRLSLTSDFGGSGCQVSGTGNDVAVMAIDDPSPTQASYTFVGRATQATIGVTLSWLENSAIQTGFKILRSTEGGAFGLIATVGASARTFTDSAADPDLNYVYRIVAFNASGDIGDPTDVVVPHAFPTVTERRQQVLDTLAAAVPGAGDLKSEFPYQIAKMIENPVNSAAFNNAQVRALALLVANATDTDPFRTHAAMHGFLVAGSLYTPQMIAETKRVVQLPTFSLTSSYVSENFYFMYNGSAFLACEQWPDFKDASGQTGATFKAGLRSQLLTAFDRVVRTNLWEHGSTSYVACDLAPIRMVAEFAQDAEVKQKAWTVLDWLMLNVACDWNQGYYATAAARCKGWGDVNSSPDQASQTSLAGWMYYGSFRPQTSLNLSHQFWVGYFRQYNTPAVYQRIASERSTSFQHRSVMQSSSYNTDFKTTWHTPDYSLASMYELWQDSTGGGKEQQPVVLKWLSDTPESTLILGSENQVQFYFSGRVHSLSFFPYDPAPNSMGYGTNPYFQHFQNRQTILGVCNVSPWYANTAPDLTADEAAATSGIDPLKYAELYVPITQKGAIKKTVESNGWVFFHGGTTMFAVWTFSPYYWGPDVSGCRMLRSRALKNAWVLETAAVSEYPSATTVDNQLAAFQADIVAHSSVITTSLGAVLPRVQYTSIHGYSMDLTWRPHKTDNYWARGRFTDPKGWNTATDYNYTTQAKVDGVTVPYIRASWPLLDNPWVNAVAGGTSTNLIVDGYTYSYLFPVNSTTWTSPSAPAINVSAAPTAIVGQNFAIAGTVTGAPSAPQWALVSGPGGASFGSGTSAATTATFSQPGAYVLQLSATNAFGATTQTLNVTAAYTAPPAGLTAVFGYSQVALAWGAVPGATGYKIKRASSSGGPYTTLATLSATTGYVDASVTNAYTYYYVVTETGNGEESASSNEASAISTPFANYSFETPVMSAVPYYSYTPAGASWTIGTRVDNYNKSAISANATAFTSSNPNTPYGLQVAAIEGTNYISQTVGSLVPGGAYRMTFAAAQRQSPINGGQTWDLRRDGVTFASFAPGASLSAFIDLSCTFTATAASHTIAFYGTNGGVTGTSSTDNTVLLDNVRLALLAPVAPPSLSGSAGNAQVTLAWPPVAGAANYNVKRSLISGSGYTTIATVSGTTHIDLTALNQTAYYYVVTAVNGGGEGAASNQVAARPVLPFSASESYPPTFTLSSTNGQVNVNTVVGRSYQLQRSDILPSANWTNIGSPVTGTGGAMLLTDPAAPAVVPRRFFRVLITRICLAP